MNCKTAKYDTVCNFLIILPGEFLGRYVHCMQKWLFQSKPLQLTAEAWLHLLSITTFHLTQFRENRF